MNQLILNKIKHKPLLIEKIFPYTTNRPLIFQILLKSDLSLKESLKNTYKSLKKHNNLGIKTNDIFYKFKSYRILFEKNLFEKYLINLEYILDYLRNCSYQIFLDSYFFYILSENIKEEINNKALYNFISDYFQYHKKLCLYIFPNGKSNLDFFKTCKILDEVKNKYINLIFFFRW